MDMSIKDKKDKVRGNMYKDAFCVFMWYGAYQVGTKDDARLIKETISMIMEFAKALKEVENEGSAEEKNQIEVAMEQAYKLVLNRFARLNYQCK